MPIIESAFGGVRVIFRRNNVNISHGDIKDVTKDVTKDVRKELSNRQNLILNMIKENSFVTISQMSLKAGVVIRTIKRDIEVMQKKGILSPRGGRKDEEWVIIVNNN